MAGDGITTDTHDFHSLLDERTDVITVSAGLLGTAGSIVLRVKIQQHCVHRGPGKGVDEIPRFIGLILRGDNGSRAADFQNIGGRGVRCHQYQAGKYGYKSCHAFCGRGLYQDI